MKNFFRTLFATLWLVFAIIPCAVIFSACAVETPVISVQPQDVTVDVGEDAVLTVTAHISDGKLNYAWYKNTSNTTVGGTQVGENSANYSADTSAAGVYYYYVIVSVSDSTASCTSKAAVVTVNAIVEQPTADTPLITTQPENRTVYQNKNIALLSVSATGNGSLTYQWHKTTGAEDMTTLAPVGAESSFAPSTADVGVFYYYAVVTNTLNGTIATAKSNVATVTVKEIPKAEISMTASNGTPIYVGDDVKLNFTISMQGGGVSWKWYKNMDNAIIGGVEVAGSSMSITADTSTSGAFYYYAIATLTASDVTVTSNIIKVTVEEPILAFTKDLTEDAVIDTFRGSYNFEVNVVHPSSATLKYEWQVSDGDPENWVNVIGVNSNKYTYLSINPGFYYVRVIVTDISQDEEPQDTITSKVARVRVDEIKAMVPFIWDEPNSVEVTEGDEVKLSVGAESTDLGTLSYQWYRSSTVDGEGFAIPNATSYDFWASSDISVYYYYVVVTNTVPAYMVHNVNTASVSSMKAMVTINPNLIFTQNLADDDITIETFKGSHDFEVTVSLHSGVTNSYDWQISEDITTWTTVISGSNNTSRYFFNTPGIFYVRVVVTGRHTSGAQAVVTSLVTKVTVREIKAEVPQIFSELDSIELTEDETAVISIGAASMDGGVLSYQWYVCETIDVVGTEIYGATNSVYTVPSVVGARYYYVVVTNTVPAYMVHNVNTASVTSIRAKVTINPKVVVPPEKPVITQETAYFDTVQGRPVTLKVTVSITDYGYLTYQWYKCDENGENAEEITGAMTNEYEVSATTFGAYYYFVRVTNTDINDNTNMTLTDSEIFTVLVIEEIQPPTTEN